MSPTRGHLSRRRSARASYDSCCSSYLPDMYEPVQLLRTPQPQRALASHSCSAAVCMLCSVVSWVEPEPPEAQQYRSMYDVLYVSYGYVYHLLPSYIRVLFFVLIKFHTATHNTSSPTRNTAQMLPVLQEVPSCPTPESNLLQLPLVYLVYNTRRK